MGVDIEVYRARFGRNDLKMKPKFKAKKTTAIQGI